jgi:hypothetical protein
MTRSGLSLAGKMHVGDADVAVGEHHDPLVARLDR